MPYLVDGHNLIPKAGLRLDSIDDEMKLVTVLQEFCRLHRKRLEVYFDGAPAGQAGTRSFGTVKAHFIRAETTADAVITRRLKKMGRAAKNWTVVSSDRQIKAEARASGAKVLSSDEFAGLLHQLMYSKNSKPNVDRKISSVEVDEWLDIFNTNKNRFC